MKIVKAASGKQAVKMSKKEWQSIGKKAGWMKTADFGEDPSTTFEYHINLDERGEFFADVRNSQTDETVFEIKGFEIFEEGYMSSADDVAGLKDYLVNVVGLLKYDDDLILGSAI